MGRPAVVRHRSGCKCCGGQKLFQIPIRLRLLPPLPTPQPWPEPEWVQLKLPLKDCPAYVSMRNMLRPGKRISPLAKMILDIVITFPGCTRKQIVQKSGYRLKFTSVSSYVTYMTHEGILIADTFSKAHRYTVAPTLKIRRVK